MSKRNIGMAEIQYVIDLPKRVFRAMLVFVIGLCCISISVYTEKLEFMLFLGIIFLCYFIYLVAVEPKKHLAKLRKENEQNNC